MPRVTLTAINSKIQEKYPNVEFVKGNGYFYMKSLNDAGDRLISMLKTTSIMTNRLGVQSVGEWVSELVEMLDKAAEILADKPEPKSFFTKDGKFKLNS